MKQKTQQIFESSLSGIKGDPWLAQRLLREVNGGKTAKKKLTVGLVFVLLLILSTVTALAVGAFSALFRLKQEDMGSMRSCVSTGDALYLMSSSGMSRWTPGDEAPVTLVSMDELHELGISFEALLYLDGDAIGLLDTENKKLWQYRDGEWNAQLDYEGTAMDMSDARVKAAVCEDKTLFLLTQHSGHSASKAVLYRANPKNGEMTQLADIQGNVRELCNYEPGKVLALVSDGEAMNESVLVLDATTGAIRETLYTAPVQEIHGLAYSKEQGELYALAGGVLSRWNGAEWIGLNSAAHGFLAESFAVVDGGYVSVSFDEMQYFPFSPEISAASLTIRGMMAVDNADAAFQETSGIAVTRHLDPALTALDVREMIEGGDTTDLFHLFLNADVIELIRDGLIAPIGSSDILADDARAMAPVIREALFDQGAFYAMAYLIAPQVWHGPDAIPQTYAELFSLIGDSGNDAFVIGYEGGADWTKEQYTDALLQAFIAESLRDEGTIDFHHQAFADALLILKNAVLPSDAGASSQIRINPAKVLSLNGDFPDDLPDRGERNYEMETEYIDEPQWLLPPTVASEARPSVPVKLSVYLLNRNAQNPDAALAYLDYVATHRDAGREGLLKPDQAEPVLHPGVQSELNWRWEMQRDTAADSSAHEAALQAYEAAVRAAPDSWAITEKRLDLYQNAFLPYLDLRLHPLFSASAKKDGGIYDLLLKTALNYVEGDMALEECLNSLQETLNCLPGYGGSPL